MFRFMLRLVLAVSIGLTAPTGWAAAAPITPRAPAGLEIQALIPLERLLNADGTLNLTTGFSGSVDQRGWEMRTDANGAPHFVRTSETSATATPFNLSAVPMMRPGMGDSICPARATPSSRWR